MSSAKLASQVPALQATLTNDSTPIVVRARDDYTNVVGMTVTAAKN